MITNEATSFRPIGNPTAYVQYLENFHTSHEHPVTTSAYTAGLSFTGWELDLFGRVASLKDAALAQYLASEEARRAVQASLIAAVANTWLNLQTNDQLLAITLSTLKTREDSLRLTRLRLDNGASSALDASTTVNPAWRRSSAIARRIKISSSTRSIRKFGEAPLISARAASVIYTLIPIPGLSVPGG